MNGVATDSNRTLLAGLFATVGMLFTAFGAAFLEQRGDASSWPVVDLPNLVWINTAILALSSVLLEVGRRRRNRPLLAATLLLGVLFLVSQVGLWWVLRARGVYLPSSSYAAFVYILTGLHAVHLLAGLVALAYGLARPGVLRFCAGFWHFLGVVWLYVLGVLLVL